MELSTFCPRTACKSERALQGLAGPWEIQSFPSPSPLLHFLRNHRSRPFGVAPGDRSLSSSILHYSIDCRPKPQGLKHLSSSLLLLWIVWAQLGSVHSWSQRGLPSAVLGGWSHLKLWLLWMAQMVPSRGWAVHQNPYTWPFCVAWPSHSRQLASQGWHPRREFQGRQAEATGFLWPYLRSLGPSLLPHSMGQARPSPAEIQSKGDRSPPPVVRWATSE